MKTVTFFLILTPRKTRKVKFALLLQSNINSDTPYYKLNVVTFFVTKLNSNRLDLKKKFGMKKKPTFKNRVLHLLDFTLGSIPNIFKVKK